MKDFDLEKILKDPSKIELDPTSPLTWALGAGALLVLILLATILFFLIRGIRRSLEARGQRKAAERAGARNLARRSELPIEDGAAPSTAVRTPLADPDEKTVWPLEPFGVESSTEDAGAMESSRV